MDSPGVPINVEVRYSTVVKNMWSKSKMTQSRAKLLQSGMELTKKVGEQPWP